MTFRPLNIPPDDSPGEHRYIHVIGSAVFVDDRPADPDWDAHVIGVVDGEVWWAVDVPRDADDPSYGAAVDLRKFYGMTPEHHWLAAGRAVQVVEWARTHQFCGRCSGPTQVADGERAMRCDRCGLQAFPRLSPAMITLVTRGEGPDQEALLARGVQWNVPMYSCLAGFVEPGESLEAAVVREVHEEVAVTVRNPNYFGSQPWPFPNSLMVGFTAEYDSGDIECDPTEIADAGWFRRDDLPMIPPGISIARKLIDAWALG